MLPASRQRGYAVFCLSLIVAIAGGGLFALLAFAASPWRSVGMLAWSLPIGFTINGMSVAATYWLLRQRQFSRVAVARVAGSMITVALQLIAGASGYPLAAFLVLGTIVGPGVTIVAAFSKRVGRRREARVVRSCCVGTRVSTLPVGRGGRCVDRNTWHASPRARSVDVVSGGPHRSVLHGSALGHCSRQPRGQCGRTGFLSANVGTSAPWTRVVEHHGFCIAAPCRTWAGSVGRRVAVWSTAADVASRRVVDGDRQVCAAARARGILPIDLFATVCTFRRPATPRVCAHRAPLVVRRSIRRARRRPCRLPRFTVRTGRGAWRLDGDTILSSNGVELGACANRIATIAGSQCLTAALSAVELRKRATELCCSVAFSRRPWSALGVDRCGERRCHRGASSPRFIVRTTFDIPTSCSGAWRAIRLRWALQHLASEDAPTRVVEYGAGGGWLVSEFAESPLVSEAIGVEPDERTVVAHRERCRGRLRAGFIGSASLDPAPVGTRHDLVVAVHVLEHLIDPDEALATIRRDHETHTLFLEVPDAVYEADAMVATVAQSTSLDQHLWSFSSDGLSRLLERHGYVIHALAQTGKAGFWQHYTRGQCVRARREEVHAVRGKGKAALASLAKLAAAHVSHVVGYPSSRRFDRADLPSLRVLARLNAADAAL